MARSYAGSAAAGAVSFVSWSGDGVALFVVAEALTNVAKRAAAQQASVAARIENGTLRIDVCDDGVGGARPDGGGLLGLRDRVVTLGGDFEVDSSPGAGTRITVTLPLRR